MNPEIKKHLWEIKHPYYCSDSNYFQSGSSNTQTQYDYDSFSDFLEDWGDADHDMNLVFRWDWNGFVDDGIFHDTLKIFIFHQRKGYFVVCDIQVYKLDEQAVIEYLLPRLNTMKQLWEPLL